MKKFILTALLCITLSSCQKASEAFDNALFSSFGKTFFGTATNVSLKEIHFEPGHFEEGYVIVQAYVTMVGEYSTFVVLQDSSAKLLVVQTLIPSFGDRIQEGDIGKQYRILGKLVVRKKGLPAIEARSVLLM